MTPAVRIATYLGAALIGLLAWNLAVRVFLGHTVFPRLKAEREYFEYAAPDTSRALPINRYDSERAAKK
jgi:hypothetical protein